MIFQKEYIKIVKKESIEKQLATKRKNGTMNSNTPESIAKCIETKRKNGTLKPSTDTIKKRLETRKQNNTIIPAWAHTKEATQKSALTRQFNSLKKYDISTLEEFQEYLKLTKREQRKWRENFDHFSMCPCWYYCIILFSCF